MQRKANGCACGIDHDVNGAGSAVGDKRLMEFIRTTDPKAFVTIYDVHEVMYQPKPLR